MNELIICETNKGNFAVRPINWAGIWDVKGRLKEVGANCPALFQSKEDAEEYVKLKNLQESGKLYELPCAVGDTVYEVLHDNIPVPVDYIAKYPVEDVSVKGIRYAGDWIVWDELRDVYFSKEEAEERLRELAAGGNT